MGWIIVIIIIVVVIILKFRSEYNNEVKTHVTNFGGMQTKYGTLINFFLTNMNGRITKLNKDTVIISSRAVAVSMDYVGGNLEVRIKGVAPMIGNYSKTWKFPNGYPQEKMIEEIENYFTWQVNNMKNLSEKDYGKYINY